MINSSELKSFLTGLIIGDGSIGKGVTKRDFRIKTIYKDFAIYIYEYIKNNTNFDIRIKEFDGYTDKNDVNHKKYWEIIVKAHPYFNKKYNNFYDDYRRRIITKNAANWLTPAGIANWYMSDGYVCLVGKTKGNIRHRRIDICTDRYKLGDIKMICEVINNKYNLDFHPIKRNDTYRIRLSLKAYSAFINLIKPYIVPSMMFKLYLGYQKQPIWMTEEDWEFQNSISAIALPSNVEG